MYGRLLGVGVSVLALFFPVGEATAVARPTTQIIVDTRPAGNLVRSSPATFKTATTWLYGDSITVQTWRNLRLGNRLAVDAKWGRASGPTVDRLMADLKATKRSPRVVVVATGSNDFANRGALTVAIARVAHASKVRGFRLVWVNVYRANLDPAPVNRIIARGGPRVHVADWFTLITHHLNPTTGRSPWLKDGVHVNAEGAQWRTNLLRRAIVG